MDATSWAAVAASFTGAGLAFGGAWLGARQSGVAARREEWGRRFTLALESIQSPQLRSRVLGRTLLAELATSNLATAEERDLAERLLTQEATVDPHGADLRLLDPGINLDSAVFVEDDDPERQRGSP